MAWRLALAGLATALAASAAAQTAPTAATLAMATGEVAGTYYPIGGAVCRLVNKDRDRHGLRCLVEPTAGSGTNLQELRDGVVDLAVVQSRAQRLAFQGQAPFTELGAFAELRSLAALHGEAVVVLAGKAAKVKSIKDLKGKKVNLGRPNSYQRLMAETVLAAAGVEPASFEATLELEIEQQKEALCDGRVDVAFFSGLHPMNAVQQALADCEAQVVELPAAVAVEVVKKAPFLAPQTVPAELYDGLDKPVKTVAMKATLVTTAKLPDEAAYQVVKALLDNFDALRAMHPLLEALRKEEMVGDGLTAPLHEGALRAFKESGVRP